MLTENSKALDRLPLIPVAKFDAAAVEEQWVEKLELEELKRPGAG